MLHINWKLLKLPHLLFLIDAFGISLVVFVCTDANKTTYTIAYYTELALIGLVLDDSYPKFLQ